MEEIEETLDMRSFNGSFTIAQKDNKKPKVFFTSDY